MNDCPLCHLERMPEQKVVLESEYSLLLQMPQEILIGSGLIVPKAHRETVFDLTTEEWNDLYHFLEQVKNLLDEVLSPDGYNLGWNCGTVGGQHIPHAHLHVIPRFADEPFAGRGIRLAEKFGKPQAVQIKALTSSGCGVENLISNLWKIDQMQNQPRLLRPYRR